MRMRKSQIVPTFNRVADTYDDRFGDECARMHRAVLDWAGEDGAPTGTLLDVGCGTGMLLARAARQWPDLELIGIDPAERMLTRARAAVPAADLRPGVAEQLPVATGSVELVVSTTSFGQWTDQLAGLREIHRVLTPAGRCYLAELNRPSWRRRALFRLPEFRDADQTRRLMTTAGLRVRRLEVTPDDVVVTAAIRG